MAYIGFDLDETLGRFSAVSIHSIFITPDAAYKYLFRGLEPFTPDEELRGKLAVCLNEFARCLVARDSEIGLLRPGILPIVKRLADAKDRGQVRALSVYSNNGNLGILILATTMIETALGKPGLFCNHIDWHNPMRLGEVTPGRPGMAKKTARVLRESFLDPRCGGTETIPNENLYFFDDTVHPLLEFFIGERNYFKVNPYKRDPLDLRPLDDCLIMALEKSGLKDDPKYFEYIKPMATGLSGEANSIPGILEVIHSVNAGDYKPVQWAYVDDTEAILARIDELFPLPNYSENYFSVVDGGKRGRKLTKRRAHMRKSMSKRKTRQSKARKN